MFYIVAPTISTATLQNINGTLLMATNNMTVPVTIQPSESIIIIIHWYSITVNGCFILWMFYIVAPSNSTATLQNINGTLLMATNNMTVPVTIEPSESIIIIHWYSITNDNYSSNYYYYYYYYSFLLSD